MIDFYIGTNQSVTCKTDKGMGLQGHTPFYSSPEIMNLKDPENYTGSEEISPFKAQMYSVGVLVLESMDFFTKFVISEGLFGKYKVSIDKYNDFEKKIKEFVAMNNSDLLMINLIEVCANCIAYNPSKRPTAYELQSVLKNLSLKNPLIISQEFLNLQQIRQKSRQETKVKLISLEAKIKECEKTIKEKSNELEEINNLKSKISSCRLEKTSLEKEVVKLQEENKSYESKISELNKEITDNSENEKLARNSQHEIEMQEKQLNELQLSNANLIKVNEEKVKQINSLKNSLSENHNKIASLEQEQSVSNIEYNSMNKELKEKLEVIEKISKDKDTLNIKIDSLSNEKKQLEEKYNELFMILGENFEEAKSRIIPENSYMSPEQKEQLSANSHINIDFFSFLLETGKIEKDELLKQENKIEANKGPQALENGLQFHPQNAMLGNQSDLNENGRKTLLLHQRLPGLQKHDEAKPPNAQRNSLIDFPFSNFVKMFQRFIEKFTEIGIIKGASATIEDLVEKINIKTCIEKIQNIYKFCNPIFIEKILREQKATTISDVYVNEKCTFSGQVENQIPDGKGILKYKDGITYSTTFNKGKILDFAIIEKADDIYLGIFNIDFLDGICLKWADYKKTVIKRLIQYILVILETLSLKYLEKCLIVKEKHIKVIILGILEKVWESN